MIVALEVTAAYMWFNHTWMILLKWGHREGSVVHQNGPGKSQERIQSKRQLSEWRQGMQVVLHDGVCRYQQNFLLCLSGVKDSFQAQIHKSTRTRTSAKGALRPFSRPCFSSTAVAEAKFHTAKRALKVYQSLVGRALLAASKLQSSWIPCVLQISGFSRVYTAVEPSTAISFWSHGPGWSCRRLTLDSPGAEHTLDGYSPPMMT